jgi:two-component system cell cycle sensor histidine kinase/response regulator CckA
VARANTESDMAPVAQAGLARKEDDPRQTILLVEDEDFVRKVTCEVLRFAGYEVLPARNAIEAAAIFAHWKQRVALLLSDVVLPGRTGGELARELRAIDPALKVILISGYPQGRLSTPPAREFQYLEKPFSATTLMQKVWLVLHDQYAATPQSATPRFVSGD